MKSLQGDEENDFLKNVWHTKCI